MLLHILLIFILRPLCVELYKKIDWFHHFFFAPEQYFCLNWDQRRRVNKFEEVVVFVMLRIVELFTKRKLLVFEDHHVRRRRLCSEWEHLVYTYHFSRLFLHPARVWTVHSVDIAVEVEIQRLENVVMQLVHQSFHDQSCVKVLWFHTWVPPLVDHRKELVAKLRFVYLIVVNPFFVEVVGGVERLIEIESGLKVRLVAWLNEGWIL